ncbi:ferritin family protein, partial [Rhizobium sp.]|uniref:ferritin family protein n=1 Tax=Rhizobium sp. TaxID=391 RepID=UPI002F02EA72
MLLGFFRSPKRSFASLSEQEILAVAIAAEEDDARIFLAYADILRDQYPDSAKVFEDMAEVEDTHRKTLIDMHRRRFGERIPLIRREHVIGFYDRKPDWLRKNLSLDAIRQEAEVMEQQAYNFYVEAAKQISDASTRQLLGDLALAEQGHEEVARMLGDKHTPESVKVEEDAHARRQFVL